MNTTQENGKQGIVQQLKPDSEWNKKVINGEYKLEKSEKIKFTLLTEDEKKWIASNLTCPDCLKGSLIAGPHGGLSINYTCDNTECGSKFNIAAFGDNMGVGILHAERI